MPKPLGETQLCVIRSLRTQQGYWYNGCGWLWDNPSGTTKIMEGLLKRGIVTKIEKNQYGVAQYNLVAELMEDRQVDTETEQEVVLEVVHTVEKPAPKKLSKRLAMKMAIQNAAMVVRESDLEALYGELYYEWCGDDDAVDIMAAAQKKVVERIEAMIKD